MKKTIAVFLLLLTSACATVWNKPGATGEMFADDQLKCEAHMAMSCGNAAEYAAICRNRAFGQCMENRGWARQ